MRCKFIKDFNLLLRILSSSHFNIRVFLNLFKAYDSNIYGASLWFNLNKCSEAFSQLKLSFIKLLRNSFKSHSDQAIRKFLKELTRILTFE